MESSPEENQAPKPEENPEANPELKPEEDTEQNPEPKPEPMPTADKYAKAKIEEPNMRLPKALLKPDCDPNDDLCYMRIYEEDGRKSQHLFDAMLAGAEPERKVYRIRNKELVKVLGKDDEEINRIHRLTKCTIGILADAESNEHRQSYLDLVGTVEQVKMAEELILDAALKTYDDMLFPVILMPPTVYSHQMHVHFSRLLPLLGVRRSRILRMEMISGAWIKVDVSKSPPGGSSMDRIVDIFGPKHNVIKAMIELSQVITEPLDSSETGRKRRNDFYEPERVGGKFKPAADDVRSIQFGSFSVEKDKSAGSGSGTKQDDVEGSGGGAQDEEEERRMKMEAIRKGKAPAPPSGSDESE